MTFRPNIVHLAETSSTSDVLRQMALNGQAEADFTSVVADFQTSGRGQVGNHWESEAGANLLFSTIFHPCQCDVSRQFMISMAVALAVCDVLAPLLPHSARKVLKVKWPNDIYVGDSKICGILVENQLSGRLIASSIVGVGLNVNQTLFRHAPNPVSVKLLTGADTPVAPLADSLILALRLRLYAVSQGLDSQVMSDYWAALYRADGCFHLFATPDSRFSARIVGVAPDGRLTLETDQAERRTFLFKEVETVITTPNGDLTPNI